MLRVYRHYMPRLLFITVAVDLAVIGLVMLSSQWLGFPSGEGALGPKMVIVIGANLLAFYMSDLYKLDFQVRRVEIASRLLVALCVSPRQLRRSAMLCHVRSRRLAFTYTFGVAALVLLAWRLAWLNVAARRQLRHRVLVLGVGPAVSVLPELQFSPTRPFTVLGFVDDAPDAQDRVPAGFISWARRRTF